MAQITPERPYDQDLVSRVIEYLQSGKTYLFPFTARFTAEQRQAFQRDLREGLGELLDSGSARKTSATGHLMSDDRLEEILQEWRTAGGGWPIGSDPDAIETALAALEENEDPDDDLELGGAQVDDELGAWRGWSF